MPEQITIRCKYALGDVVVLTAAIRDLARSYPGRFDIAVDTGAPEVWRHNPYVRPRILPGRVIDCKNALIDRPGALGKHYVHAYLDLLNDQLGTKAQISEIKGDIHLSDEERSWYSQTWNLCGREIPYWLICSGGKFDLPIKWWDHCRYQQVVDALRGKIQFVQVGWWGNHHPPLDGVIDLRGKTSTRDLIHLVYHADGVVCGVTSLMHLAAAAPEREIKRTAVVIAGDREPRVWEAYPEHLYLSAGKKMECGNCWKSRVASGSETGKGICTRVQNGLPECLDAVTAEKVIEAIDNLEAASRARFLNSKQTRFAQAAEREARERNAFEADNITLTNAPAKAEEFLRKVAVYPRNRYLGRGIVICAGTVTYFTQAWICIKVLRQLGCKLPVEVWHFGGAELDQAMAALLAPYDVRCIDASTKMKEAPMRNPLGWELKCYSVLHSRFREVLSLDADNVPVVDPTFLFDSPEFRQTGAIFWPDYKRLGRTRSIWKLCGVKYRDEPEFESGQMVIDKEKCWRALNLAWWYNDHSEFFYRHIHGDKDTFHMAWRRTETAYAMPPYPIESLEGVMCQHDFSGRRIFQHRNSHKWAFFGENRRIVGFHFEEDCRKHLDELRAIWDGKINGRRECKIWQGVQVRPQTVDREVVQSVAFANEYKLPPSFHARDVIIDIGAHIGSFTLACHERGSREIHAFEPHPENFSLLRQNVGSSEGVSVYEAAILDKSRSACIPVFTRELGKQNTGAVKLAAGRGGVKVYGIDALLEQFEFVALLKLDCEGSEWRILANLMQWHRVGAICGEFHQDGTHTRSDLITILQQRFRYIRVQEPNQDGLGKFWGSHIRIFQSDADSKRLTSRGRKIR